VRAATAFVVLVAAVDALATVSIWMPAGLEANPAVYLIIAGSGYLGYCLVRVGLAWAAMEIGQRLKPLSLGSSLVRTVFIAHALLAVYLTALLFSYFG
jgi:hypothetical protein